MDMDHTLGLLYDHETPRPYNVREFLRITRTTQVAATIVACDLYYIPSRSSCYHEFLLVHATEGFMLVIERAPANNGRQVISSNGGVARDTITVVRAREQHEYWRSTGQDPVCRGTLLWHQHSPRLLDIAFLASTASTTSKHYNLYTRQCYWYARITLTAIAKAFPSCSRDGTTSFSRRWLSVFGNFKPSQVQLLVDLHTDYCWDLRPLADNPAPLAPTMEADRHPPLFVTPDVLRRLVAFVASIQRPLPQMMFPEPEAVIESWHGEHSSGGIP
ncbi:hypothetical protein EDC04DRAFT_3088733 [Pisolithus marmoratus]|nr:hypothetical protein EDC04DRAFT_3088733 [Pisolithus marmoratus]